ncbi:hypothetical protein DFP73DRAFT_532223 [Morchella snyderi]|nr:hypothetical protein DFP73DRAFT_532223 [Morchella snyderi]
MIDQTAPGPAVVFRSAVAYIVRNFAPRQRLRARTTPPLSAGGGELLHVRLSEVIHVFTPQTQTLRFVAMMGIMELAKRLHLREVLAREYKSSTDRQEREVLEIIMEELGGDAKHGPVRGERPRAEGNAVARATVFLNGRGERIAAATEEMRQVMLQCSRVAPEVPDAALVEETYAILGGSGNKRLGGLGVFQETMATNPCFFRLVRIATVACIKNWYLVLVADPGIDAGEEDSR